MAVLLIINFGLTAFLIARHRPQLGLEPLSWRGAIVVAQLAFQGQVVLITEVSSAAHAFDAPAIISAWLLLLVAQLLLGGADLFAAAQSFSSRARWPARLRAWDQAFIAAIVAIFATLIVVGWRYPPSNGDSMVYHLPRVMQWIQNGSIAHFATHYLAQIELAPLHEFNLAQLHILSGGTDRLDGYVQLMALAISVVGASEMARLLGAGVSGQVLAALLCATLPSALLEATSTQNNVFASSIGIGILLVLIAWRPGPGTLPRAAILGGSLGLAALAKGTLPILLAPTCLALGLVVLRHERQGGGPMSKRLLASLVIVAISAVVVAGPFFTRNYVLFGRLTGPVSMGTVSSQLTIQAAGGNILRSTAANFMIGNGRDGIATSVSSAFLSRFERAWQPLGIRPEDTRYSLGWDFDAFKVQDYSVRARLEEFAANPSTVVLTCWAICYLVIAAVRRPEARLAALLAAGLGCGFLLFSGTMRWSVFVVRYQVPLFLAWSAPIALSFERYRFVGRAVGIFLLVACLPQLLDNHARSLLNPRYPFPSALAEYFQDGKNTSAYEDVTGVLAKSRCQSLGISNWVLYEYPLWAGLRESGWKGRIEHVGVSNESRRLADLQFRPCAEIFEVKPDYVARDPNKLTLYFGILGLSIDPDAVLPGEIVEGSLVR